MAVSLSANVRNRRKGRDNPPIAKARKWAPPPGVLTRNGYKAGGFPTAAPREQRRAVVRRSRWLGSLPKEW
jgi:hypothetical protein